MKKTVEKKHLSRFAWIMIALSAAAFLFVAVHSLQAVRDMAACYDELLRTDMSAGGSVTLYYDDGLYAVLGYGADFQPGDGNVQTLLSSFLDDAVRGIDARILAAGLVYTMMISCMAAYAVYEKSLAAGKKYPLPNALSVCGIYAAYLLFILLLHGIYRMPFVFPEGRDLSVFAAGLLSIVGGNCALCRLFSRFRYRKVCAVAAVPLCFVLLLFSTVLEGRMFVPAYTESFDYVSDIDDRVLDTSFEGPLYYDQDRNVLVVGETAYPPQQEVNPDHLGGIARAGAYLYEILDPWSGSVLPVTEQIVQDSLPFTTITAYAVKALCWIFML